MRVFPNQDLPVRIAYVTETYPPEINGVAITAERVVRHLRGAGHEVQQTTREQMEVTGAVK